MRTSRTGFSLKTLVQGRRTRFSLCIKLIDYPNRALIAQRLRELAHWVEEGVVTPFGVPEDRRGLEVPFDRQSRRKATDGNSN
jgi:hypothetical protein